MVEIYVLHSWFLVLLLHSSEGSGKRMEMSTTPLAANRAGNPWNYLWDIFADPGFTYIFDHGLLGYEWWLVNGVLWYCWIWIRVAYFAVSCGFYFAGISAAWQKVFWPRHWFTKLKIILKCIACYYKVLVICLCLIVLPMYDFRIMLPTGPIAFSTGLLCTKMCIRFIIHTNNLRHFQSLHYIP